MCKELALNCQVQERRVAVAEPLERTWSFARLSVCLR